MYSRIKHFVRTTAVGIAAAAALATAASAADWRAWNIHHEGHPNTAAMDRFAELVKNYTNGEITVQVFHGGVLGSQPDALEQVRIGAIEIGNFNLGPIGPMVKEANLVSLPFVLPFCLLIAAALMMQGASPFYRQERVGKDGKRFMMWKFVITVGILVTILLFPRVRPLVWVGSMRLRQSVKRLTTTNVIIHPENWNIAT